MVRKKDKLYTVNKWNKKLFLTGGETDSADSNYGTNFSGQNRSVVYTPWSSLTARSGNNEVAARNNTNYALGQTQNNADNSSEWNWVSQLSSGQLAGGNAVPNVDYTQAEQSDSNDGGNVLDTILSGARPLTPSLIDALTSETASTTAQTAAQSGLSTAANAGAQAAGTGLSNAAANMTGSTIADLTSQTATDAMLGAGTVTGAASQAADVIPAGAAIAAPAATTGGFSSFMNSGAGRAGANAAASIIGGLGKAGISDGLQTSTGDNIATVGTLAGGVVSAIPGVGWFVGPAITLGSNLVGGLVNRGWGHKTYGVGTAKNYLNTMSGVKVGGSNDDVETLAGALSEAPKVTYRDGWFTDKGKKEAASWNDKTDYTYDFLNRSVANAAINNATTQLRNMQKNYTAFGGFLGNGEIAGPSDYNFMSDYLTMKNTQNQNSNKPYGLGNSYIASNTAGTFFADGGKIGGVLQSHGANFTNGVKQVNAGGTHEQNPNEGVQMSVDEDGTPNLVEEGEVVWNDFVFSDRITVPKETRRKFGIHGKKTMTFADAAKKVQKESEERPNDPISRAGLSAALEGLADAQETLKTEMAAKEAKAEFDSLSPEEQMAVMQSLKQNAQQQVNPEEVAAMEQQAAQQQAMAQGQQQQMAQAGQLAPEDAAAQALQASMQSGTGYAFGGKVNKFDGTSGKSSKMQIRLPKRYRKYNEKWFEDYAKSLGLTDEEMQNFTFSKDPEANLINFNNIYREHQRQKALDEYVKAQRQSFRNKELESGRYKLSDDGNNIFRATYYGDDMLGKNFINAAGDRITEEAYNKLPKEQRDAYRRENVVKGQFARDYSGNIIYDSNAPISLASWNGDDYDFGKDFQDGFKWKDDDALKINYAVEPHTSTLSYLRYAPALGGAIGLVDNVFSSPDYSRADAIEAAAHYDVPQVEATPIGDYLTYRPFDRDYYINKLNAQTGATRRALLNSGSTPARGAQILAADYNQIGRLGDLARQAEEYNMDQREKVATFNRGTNQYNSENNLQAQMANAKFRQQAAKDAYKGIYAANALRDEIDARRQQGLSANLTNLMTSIGNIGEEAYDTDRLRWLEDTGVLKSDYFSGDKYGKADKKRLGGKIAKNSKKEGGER